MYRLINLERSVSLWQPGVMSEGSPESAYLRFDTRVLNAGSNEGIIN
jgi:hypothetical protein